MSAMSWAFMVDSVDFTRAVVAGETSLGGSESACLGLARALRARGHDVHIFATKLDQECQGYDSAGVAWHHLGEFVPMNQFIEWDVVVGLRMYSFFHTHMHARLRVLWNQDLLPEKNGPAVMAFAHALDKCVYVSEYHRAQWEDILPELKAIGAVTKNGYDPAFVPEHRDRCGGRGEVTKDPNRIIHISRPERGLTPLLKMWPELRKRNPHAVLQVCRYSSMYDKDGWGQVCSAFDAWTQEIAETVGGIEWLGELNKAQLYKAIAEAAVMWYPGISSFAETSCIAAIEAQANGTPFVGSLKGALPETARPAFDAHMLIPGDAEHDEAYQKASILAVEMLMDGCRRNTLAYRTLQQAGREHVTGYTYAALAGEWETTVEGWFRERYEANRIGVMRQLVHEEDLTAAKYVASEVVDEHLREERWARKPDRPGEKGERLPEAVEAHQIEQLADRVIAGGETSPEFYALHSLRDPVYEADVAQRFQTAGYYFKDSTRILDAACGNGAAAIAFARMHPHLRIVGVDYSAENIERAQAAAEKEGLSDRLTFLCAPVWDIAKGEPARLALDGVFDGLFVGEFIEHVADCAGLVDHLETFLSDGARVVYTCPSGPFVELTADGQRHQHTHVHHFRHDDIRQVFGLKSGLVAEYLSIGTSCRGVPLGHWIIRYTTKAGCAARPRDYAALVARTRPMPRLSVGMIVKDAAQDLARCLDTVRSIADEIVIGDTGSTDTTKAIATAFGATVLDIPGVMEQPEGFAGARNQVMDACSGDWFLWIDADEQLTQARKIRRYLDSPVYRGYALHQCHLMIDAAPHYDKPVRLFRNDGRIRFYGCIHEQPQQDDCNGEVVPSFEISSENRGDHMPLIIHTGYMTDAIRRHKMHSRNLPLLIKDQQVFPDRMLGKVLTMRDYVLLADEDANQHGEMTEKAQRGYALAIRIFLNHFDDPANVFHPIARPFYEMALQRLEQGTEVEFSVAGKVGGLAGARAKPMRLWVRDMAEYERVLHHKITETAKPLALTTFKTDPFVLPSQGVAA